MNNLFLDAGLSTLVNFALLALLTRQISRSRSAAGLARVSRYPFLAQSLIDSMSFVGVSASYTSNYVSDDLDFAST